MLAQAIDLGYVLAAGGIIAAIGSAGVAFLRARPDSAAVLVDASQDVVVIQKGIIDDLRAGLADTQRRVAELQSLEAQVAEMRQKLQDVESENRWLRVENKRLRERLDHIEDNGK